MRVTEWRLEDFAAIRFAKWREGLISKRMFAHEKKIDSAIRVELQGSERTKLFREAARLSGTE